MKAKELTERAIHQLNPNGEPYYVFTFDELKARDEQLCREQREICKQVYIRNGFAKDIENAPMPEI